MEMILVASFRQYITIGKFNIGCVNGQKVAGVSALPERDAVGGLTFNPIFSVVVAVDIFMSINV